MKSQKAIFSLNEKFYFFGNQKKALAAAYVVGLIIILVSVAVLVLVFSSMYSPNTTQREACKTSAIVRATLPDITGTDLKEKIFLNCKARRVCVTSDLIGDEGCSAVFGKTYDKVRITGSLEQKSEQIRMIVAREMAECWNTFGEGNLQIFKRELVAKDYSTKAVICTRFYFDNSVTSEIQTVPGLNNYMLTHKAPGQNRSYWDYLRNTVDGETLASLYENVADVDDSLNLSEQKAIIYLESGKSTIAAYIGAGAGFIAGNFVLYGVGGGILGKGLGAIAKVGNVVGGSYGKAAVYGVIEGSFLSGGAEFGSWLDSKFNTLGTANSVSAIVLTDYNQDSLSKSQIDSFQNIA